VKGSISNLSCVIASLSLAAAGRDTPPFHGTVFVEPAILQPADPTAFRELSEAGQAPRTMFDRRVAGWIEAKAWLFVASFDDGLTMEVQVNPEFGRGEAARQAHRYLPVIGQLPTALRRHVKTVWIHRGKHGFGGGNNNLMIHTEQAEEYLAQGILAEVLFHEAVHSSLDAAHAGQAGWRQAQQADGRFISVYARENPGREDLAESFLLYFALRYRRTRLADSLAATIERTMPNRIRYFDRLKLEMYPAEARPEQGQPSAATLPGPADGHR
jgi:hypothetical protein